jgi:hypothetical protein
MKFHQFSSILPLFPIKNSMFLPQLCLFRAAPDSV